MRVASQQLRRNAIVPDSNGDAASLRAYLARSSRFAFRVVCDVPPLGIQIALARDLIAMIDELGEGAYAVRWHPSDDGPFPRFTGELRLSRGAGSTFLQLTGTVEGVCDDGLDEYAELAYRLSQAAARAMLSTLSEAFEGARPAA
jgi:hypothetical protein